MSGMVVWVGDGGAGEMTSSRHWGVVDEEGLRRVAGPVGVVIVGLVLAGEGATDWKA